MFLRRGLTRKIAAQPRANQWSGQPGVFQAMCYIEMEVSIVNESFHPDLDATGLSYH
jgi:hypothetical protein